MNLSSKMTAFSQGFSFAAYEFAEHSDLTSSAALFPRHWSGRCHPMEQGDTFLQVR